MKISKIVLSLLVSSAVITANATESSCTITSSETSVTCPFPTSADDVYIVVPSTGVYTCELGSTAGTTGLVARAYAGGSANFVPKPVTSDAKTVLNVHQNSNVRNADSVIQIKFVLQDATTVNSGSNTINVVCSGPASSIAENAQAGKTGSDGEAMWIKRE